MSFEVCSNNGLEKYSYYLKFALIEIRLLRPLYHLKYAMFYIVLYVFYIIYTCTPISFFLIQNWFSFKLTLCCKLFFMLKTFEPTSSITNVDTSSVQKKINSLYLNVFFFCAQIFLSLLSNTLTISIESDIQTMQRVLFASPSVSPTSFQKIIYIFRYGTMQRVLIFKSILHFFCEASEIFKSPAWSFHCLKEFT